jgi:hypothetical protein
MMAGFISAAVTSPVDVVKTRVMKQPVTSDGKRQYRNTLDCMAQIIRTEGLFGFYKGFVPNWLRIGPHTIIVSQFFEGTLFGLYVCRLFSLILILFLYKTFLIYEQLRRIAGIRPI